MTTMYSLTLLFTFGTFPATTFAQAPEGRYKGPPVVPVILPGGFIADTEEVAAAREYHLSALAKAAAEVKDETPQTYYNSRPNQAQTYQVYKQQAEPRYQSTVSYQPAPTPSYQEVSPRYQPKSQEAYQQAPIPNNQPLPQRYTGPQESDDGSYQGSYQQAPTPNYQSQPQKYTGPQAFDDGSYQDEQYQDFSQSKRPDPLVIPHILDNGYIADTQEVDAAKQQHFALVAKAQALLTAVQEKTAKENTGVYYGGNQRVSSVGQAPPLAYFHY